MFHVHMFKCSQVSVTFPKIAYKINNTFLRHIYKCNLSGFFIVSYSIHMSNAN